MRFTKFMTVCAVSVTLFLGACQQGAGYSQNRNTYQGAAAGAVLGATAGALTGRGGKQTTRNAVIGGAIGALAGGGIGQYMDRQERAMREALRGSNVQVQRQGDNILLNMPSSITFAFDKSAVKPQFYGTLNDISGVLNQYPETRVNVVGHTDNVGDAQYNQNLSMRRAKAVSSYMSGQGVSRARLREVGAGEELPVADNTTDAGRAQNRRVEVQIIPDPQNG